MSKPYTEPRRLPWWKKVVEVVRRKVASNGPDVDCIECGACGEDPCCAPSRCQGGVFCAGYYGKVRRD